MRLYTFCNYYLSSLQQGLQTAHVVHELFNKYKRREGEQQLFDWSLNHKTIIILNGGNCATLSDLKLFLDNEGNDFPFESFCEDQQSLNNALTCVGIVLPERIYDAAEKIRSREFVFMEFGSDAYGERRLEKKSLPLGRLAPCFPAFEVKLIERLNKCGLAK